MKKETHLSNVKVIARFVNLRVVEAQDRTVQTMGRSDPSTLVVETDSVDIGAILALVAEAEFLTRNKVAAGSVDRTAVESSELEARGNEIRPNSVGSRDKITDVETFCSLEILSQ